MQYLIFLLAREFNMIRVQLGLCAGRRSDAHASSMETETSESNAERSTAPHNKKLQPLHGSTERDFDEPNDTDANRTVTMS
jgi:hypothetical protein